MPIRPATFADLLPASQIASSAFFNESLFGPVIHPHRHIYPSDVSLFFLRYLRVTFFSPTAFIYISHPTNSPLTITALGIWYRQGPLGTAALRATQPWSTWLAGKAMAVANWFHALIYPNRAADPAKLDVLERAFPYIEHYWTDAPGRAETWYLNLLATGPAYEKRGYGRELVRWGIERAREDCVCASVISSEGNEKWYQRCGFGDVVGWAREGEGNPIAKVGGGAIMFTEVFGKGEGEGKLVDV